MKLIGVIDVGTSSVRLVVFEAGTAKVVCCHQVPIILIHPRDGWCEQDPIGVFQIVVECMNIVSRRLERLNSSVKDIIAIGITNRRETTIVWDRRTGTPLYNAIVWWDHRTTETANELLNSISTDETTDKREKVDFLRPLCGLPLTPYYSAVKLRWLKENVPKVRRAMSNGSAAFGTVDSWLIYNLTGAEVSGIHVTDVTNAARTMLMNIQELKWDQRLLEFFDLPESILPEIRSCAENYGKVCVEPLVGIPITACIGNQQAALIGHQCFRQGQIKASFSTACSVLFNTGDMIVDSKNGLLTTVCYQLGRDANAVYGLEDHHASAGDAFTWLRDKIGLINTVNEIEAMASMVPNSLDVCFVPAFAGIYTPKWNQYARGVICGLSEETTSEHIVRATLEAICFEVRDTLEALKKDYPIVLDKLFVDGSMSGNALFLQLLADLLNITVVRSNTAETTALGAALAAYKAIDPNFNIRASLTLGQDQHTFKPSDKKAQRDLLYSRWKKALEHSINFEMHPVVPKKHRHDASIFK